MAVAALATTIGPKSGTGAFVADFAACVVLTVAGEGMVSSDSSPSRS